MKTDTKIVHAGRHPHDYHGIVNPPVFHASTVLFPDVATLKIASADPHGMVTYGRRGTPTTFALEEAFAALEGGYGAVSYPSGVTAIIGTLMAFVEAGDHVLITDSAYGPTRTFSKKWLKKLGVAVDFYDPLIGAEIKTLIRPNTKVVYVESPGSLTFEVQDIPAIAEVAHAHGAVVLMDNTWATPLYFKAFEKGVDVAIHAGTKYVVGHSDAMLGLAVGRDKDHYSRIKNTAGDFGLHAGPDDCYLAQRGLRTLSVRLRQHEKSALILAEWLKSRDEVTRVLHPALSDDPGHLLWKRDFTGSSGLFAFVLKPKPQALVDKFVDALKLFGIGFSWGGYESLVLPIHIGQQRQVRLWQEEGALIRLHIGLEDVDDLKDDLKQAFAQLKD